jgi:mRNA-degrading endonuclease RelE of RelBE toxin-antitoxin system
LSYNVVVTDGFKKHAKDIAKKHRSLKADLEKLIDSLEENPIQGVPLVKIATKYACQLAQKERVSPVALV